MIGEQLSPEEILQFWNKLGINKEEYDIFEACVKSTRNEFLDNKQASIFDIIIEKGEIYDLYTTNGEKTGELYYNDLALCLDFVGSIDLSAVSLFSNIFALDNPYKFPFRKHIDTQLWLWIKENKKEKEKCICKIYYKDNKFILDKIEPRKISNHLNSVLNSLVGILNNNIKTKPVIWS